MSYETVELVDKGSTLGATRKAKIDANGALLVTGLTTPGTAVTGSATGAAGAITATLTAVAGKTTYITGFMVTGGGATSASIINVTITGTITGTLNFALAVPAGATTTIQPLGQTFSCPIPASGTNVNVVVNVPSFGSGNTNAAVSAYGFNL